MTEKPTLADLVEQQRLAHAACTQAIQSLILLREEVDWRQPRTIRPRRGDIIRVEQEIMGGQKTLGEIARHLGIPKSRVQRAMDKLVKEGKARLSNRRRGFEYV